MVGATGAVGGEFLRLFEERSFPVRELRLLASERSVGKELTFRGETHMVARADGKAFEGIDVAFFSAGAGRSHALIPAALDAGALVVDNSSAFRMEPGVPLVVPEVNGAAIGANRLISVPNCTAIILCMAVQPLRSLGEIERLIVSTYQSASGAGAAVMRHLEDETRALLAGEPLPTSMLKDRYAFNLFSHNTPIRPDGFNEEEGKVMEETRKILGLPKLRMNVTCVRVPVLRAHTESVTVEFSAVAPGEDEIREVLVRSPGIRVIDDRDANDFPTPLKASGGDDVLVGRVRRDPSDERSIIMLIAGDQLLKGAALNAVQIAEHALGLPGKAARPV